MSYIILHLTPTTFFSINDSPLLLYDHLLLWYLELILLYP